MTAYTLPFSKLGRHDVETVGGKNSSLGEMISHLAQAGVTVPDGFATTAQAYRDFLQHEGLAERISKELAALDVEDVEKLTTVGARIRQWILATPFPPRLEQEILESFERMSAGRDIAVAVRSSATAEDLPDASFAGQQETFLNVRGRDALLKCVHEVFASLFNDRAIALEAQGHGLTVIAAGVAERDVLGAKAVAIHNHTGSVGASR
jgi:pyruvate,water dikinase